MTYCYVQLKIETCVGPLMREYLLNVPKTLIQMSSLHPSARWQLFLHDIFIQWWKLSTKYAGNIQKPTVYFVLIFEK